MILLRLAKMSFQHKANVYVENGAIEMNDPNEGIETDRNVNHVNNIKDAVQIIQRRINTIKNSSEPIIKEFLLPGLDDFLGKLTSAKTESLFQYKLSNWYYEIKNYGLSYIILSEAIITKICEIEKLDTQNFAARQQAKDTIKSYNDKKIYEIYKDVSKIRNSIAHETDKSGNAISSINNLRGYLEKLDIFFRQ